MAEPDAAPWLDQQERATWLSFAAVVERLPAALDAQLRIDHGLNFYEYLVLAMLSEAPGRTRRMGELAAVAHGSQSRLSHLAGRLEQRGWLTRCTDPTNGRSTLATLTDAGWEKVTAAAPGHVRAVRSLLFDALSEAQVRQLGRISQAIEGRIADPGA